MLDDAQLLSRYAKDRSEGAFAELVQRHISLVYTAALRQVGGDAHLAHDVTQEVFTDLARKARALADRPVLAGWLFTATRFAAAKQVRAARRRRAREQEAHAMNQIRPDSAEPDWERLRPVLDDVLAELGEADREAVLLRFFEGRAFATVGTRLLLTEDAARMRVDRALEKLRVALGRRGITSTAAALGVALANQAVVAAPAGLASTVTTAALAGAVTGGSTAILATIFSTMSTIKTTAIVTGVIAVFATGAAIYETQRGRQAEAALTARADEAGGLRDRLQQLEKELRDASARAQAAETSAADLRKENVRLHVANTSAKPNDIAARHEEVINRLVVTNMELRKLYARQQTIRFRTSYGPLYHALGLTSAQVGEFERVRGDNVQAQSDIFREGLAQGLAKADPIVQELIKQANKRQDDSLRAVLGDDGVQQLQTYEHTLPLRNVAGTLAKNIYFTDTPLTPKQSDQLTQIVTESMSNPPGSATLGAINWGKVLAKAPALLAPAQLEALSTMVEQMEVGKKVYAIVEPALNSQGLSVNDNYTSPPPPGGN
jgi:RNA polymerase sigma factor (sigma-70 family)